MPRVLLLLPTTTYRTDAFLAAARRCDADVTVATEEPSTMEPFERTGLVTLPLGDPVEAAVRAAEFAREVPIDAVVPVDDDTAVTAAAIGAALGLPHNSVASVRAARDKHASRAILRDAGVRVPAFAAHALTADARAVAGQTAYPCVIKPLFLSASRGVMRADTPDQFVACVERLRRLLSDRALRRRGGLLAGAYLVESFVAGREVALDGLLVNDALTTLAIFDKPDPLDGPFFEETIYVTPSRLAPDTQEAIAEEAARAARALGLTRGPVHAELRVDIAGRPWVLEVAARSIGGLCSRTLRFGGGLTLEDLILRAALGRGIDDLTREPHAAGVMMIPIPHAGVLRDVRGRAEALAVPLVEDVTIAIRRGQRVVPLPEGAQYLGFIFARGGLPEAVEHALRAAHARLTFAIEEETVGSRA